MKVTIVKAQQGDALEQDRVYIDVDGETRCVAVQVVKDLPHLVAESFFGITDGLWGEMAAGLHSDTNLATTQGGRCTGSAPVVAHTPQGQRGPVRAYGPAGECSTITGSGARNGVVGGGGPHTGSAWRKVPPIRCAGGRTRLV